MSKNRRALILPCQLSTSHVPRAAGALIEHLEPNHIRQARYWSDSVLQGPSAALPFAITLSCQAPGRRPLQLRPRPRRWPSP